MLELSRRRRDSLWSIASSFVNRDIGVAWPSTFMIIATSPPPIESIRLSAFSFAASMRALVPASSPSIAFIDAEASSRIDDAARLAIDRAERRIERGEQHEPEDQQDEQQRDAAA